jgi:hypothetical protein
MTDTTPDPATDPNNTKPQDTGEPAVTPVPAPAPDSVDGSGFIPSQDDGEKREDQH